MQRRHPICTALIRAAIAGAAFALATSAHAADKFPDKPITLIVPFAPGGNLDIVARSLAPGLGAALGGTVIVENRAGAGGAVGASYVARAKPDGTTLMVSTPNALVVSPLITTTNYQLESFTPIGTISTTPLTIVVGPKSPFTTIQALLAEARAKPGKLTVGHSGNGTTNHVALLQLESDAKLDFTIVPYKGSGPALTDLMGGQTDLMFATPQSVVSLIKSGKLRALAVSAGKRLAVMPEVPTIGESGYAGFEAVDWKALVAPAGTPADVVKALNDAVNKALGQPSTIAELLADGSAPMGGTPEQAAQKIKAEYARWGALIREAGIKLE